MTREECKQLAYKEERVVVDNKVMEELWKFYLI